MRGYQCSSWEVLAACMHHGTLSSATNGLCMQDAARRARAEQEEARRADEGMQRKLQALEERLRSAQRERCAPAPPKTSAEASR